MAGTGYNRSYHDDAHCRCGFEIPSRVWAGRARACDHCRALRVSVEAVEVVIPNGNEDLIRGAIFALAVAVVMFAVAGGWLLWLVG